MELTGVIAWAAASLVVARWAASLWLSHLNRGYVLAHANEIPEGFVGIVDEPTYARSVAYTLAKNRFNQLAETYAAFVVLVVLFSGVLPWAYEFTLRRIGSTSWSMALYLFSIALIFGLSNLPLAWIAQFRLEERFGFNTSTQKTWWLDLVKRLLLAIGFGYPLLALILRIVEWSGAAWWVWAWGTMMGFQLLVMVLAPLLILPLFNRLSPLPGGSLQERLTAMAEKARFVVQSIQVMDGSRRSSHSNAFFTGIGRFRKIVLFDTLITQIDETEMEAVLAHEIGHFRLKHIPKTILGSAVGGLAGLWMIAWLAKQPVFVEAFGFSLPAVANDFTDPGVAPALLVFALLSGTLTFWLDPLIHWISRRFEYQADAYASEVMGDPGPMIDALRKLTEKNLNNLTPHRLYSRFYYSHPTLLEREAALRES